MHGDISGQVSLDSITSAKTTVNGNSATNPINFYTSKGINSTSDTVKVNLGDASVENAEIMYKHIRLFTDFD